MSGPATINRTQWLKQLSDTKLRQFRQIVEWRATRMRHAVKKADIKVLYTLVCFEVMRRREAQRFRSRGVKL